MPDPAVTYRHHLWSDYADDVQRIVDEMRVGHIHSFKFTVIYSEEYPGAVGRSRQHQIFPGTVNSMLTGKALLMDRERAQGWRERSDG